MTPATNVTHDEPGARVRPAHMNKLVLLDATDQLQHLAELTHLTHADGKVLRRLVHHLSQADIDAGDTVVWPSAGYVAIQGCLSDRQVRSSLRRLMLAGLIEIRHRGHRRSALISLAGFMARVGDVIEAARAAVSRLRSVAEISTDDGRIFLTTETVRRTSQTVNIAATRSEIKRASATPLQNEPPSHTQNSTSSPRKPAEICPPRWARRSAGDSSESSNPTASPIGDLQMLLAHSQTGRMLGRNDVVLHLNQLESRAAEHFESTIGTARHPVRIWTWALDRYGPIETITAWILACDSPEITNPGGWFMRWVATPQRWDLSPNVTRLLTRSAEPDRLPPRIECSELPPAQDQDQDLARLAALIEAATAPATQPVQSIAGEASQAWTTFLDAWTAERGEALRRSWLDGSSCLGIGTDGRLHIEVKSAFARDWLSSRCVDTNRRAAAAAGFDAVIFTVK